MCKEKALKKLVTDMSLESEKYILLSIKQTVHLQILPRVGVDDHDFTDNFGYLSTIINTNTTPRNPK